MKQPRHGGWMNTKQAGGIRRSPTAALHELDDFLSLQRF